MNRPCLICTGAHATREHGWGSYDEATPLARAVLAGCAFRTYIQAESPPASTWEGPDVTY